MITNLLLQKSASDLAFNTISQSAPQVDAAAAAKAEELQLTDAQYAGLKNAINTFRQIYARAAGMDVQAAASAARAKSPAPAATPVAAASANNPINS